MNVFSRLAAAAMFAFIAGAGYSQAAEHLKHLGLSDEQAKQVAELLTKFEAARQPALAQLKVLAAQIGQTMTASNPDLKAVNALVDKKAALRAELEKQRLALLAQVHQLLGETLYFQVERSLFRHQGWGRGRGAGMGRTALMP